jgi:hypothetical protein
MAYGILKCDTVTFTDAGIDKSVTLSGLVQNPTFSGNVTVTGTFSGVTVTGTTANFTSGNFTNISGGTHTITSGVFAAGSAASPSITFTGDLNTGIYSPGADQVAVATNGTGRLFVDSTGVITTEAGFTSSRFNIVNPNTVSTYDSLLRLRSNALSNAYLGLGLDSFYIASATSAPMVFCTNSDGGVSGTSVPTNERLRITSAGLVGIGTSSVNALLEVNNSTAGGEVQRIEGNYSGSGSVILTNWRRAGGSVAAALKYNDDSSPLCMSIGTTTSHEFRIRTADTDAITIDTSQRVGIGTTSPGDKLDVFGIVRATNTTDSNFYSTFSNPDGLTRIRAYGGGSSICFDLGTSEKARIDSSGRLLVGTSTNIDANSKLQIESDANDKIVLKATTAVANNGSQVNWYVGSTWKTSIYGGNDASSSSLLKFSTTADGASSPTERLRITSAGLVGIGTSSPVATNHIRGSGTSGQVTASWILENASSGAVGMDVTGAAGSSIWRFLYTGSGPQTGTNTFNTALSIGVEGSVAGNVGIGTTSVGNTLHVYSTAATDAAQIQSSQNFSTLKFVSALNTNSVTIGSDGAGNAQFENKDTSKGIVFTAGGGEAARIDSSKRLLVGTSTARSNFFNSDISTSLQLEEAGLNKGFASLVINRNDTGGSALIFGKTRGTAVGSNTIVNSGDDIGAILFSGADGAQLVNGASIAAQVDGTPGANDMPGRLVFSTTADGASSPTERMRITNGGDFYFNCTVTTKTTEGFRVENDGQPSVSRGTAGSFMLFFNAGDGSSIGSITNSGGTATAYNTSSDYRLKENVNPVSDGITRLQQLKPSRFNFISDPDTVIDGFLAHEVQAVVPECVTGEKDAVDDDGNPVYQGIDQSKLVPLLTAALQEAIAKIETLEARLTAAGIE